MAEVKIRPATINDLKDIQNMNLKLFEKEIKEFDDTLNSNWTFGKEGTDYFEGRITEEDGCVLVACDDDKIIGYLSGGIHNEKISYRILPKFAELENMFIVEEFRNTGIGSMLCKNFAEWCKQKGVGRLRVVASSKNTNGINFYKKNGFADYDLVLEKDLNSN